MLRKLMKYDLRAIFKYWWIVALSSVGLSVIGGASLRFLIDISLSDTVPDGLMSLLAFVSILGVMAAVLGICAFLIATELFIYIRLYKNLFSDEGYLTFTLPVKRANILNSKIISAFITNLATLGVVIFDVLIFLIICSGESFFSSGFLEFTALIGEGVADLLGLYLLLYIIEAAVIMICLSLASYLLVFACITFAAMIAKKHKVFAAIGIYYLVSTAFSFALQIFMIFGITSIAGIMESIPLDYAPGFFALLLAVAAILTVAVVAILYTIEHYLLDKKLNLS